jgi:hypothetical protein
MTGNWKLVVTVGLMTVASTFAAQAAEFGEDRLL